MSQQTIKVEISIKSLLLVIATLVGLWVAFLLKDIIIAVFIAFILTAAIEPFAFYLKRFKIPGIISMFIAYGAVLGLLTVLGFMVVPPLVHQVELFVGNFPYLTDRVLEILAGQGIQEAQLQEYIDNVAEFLASRAEVLSNSLLQVGLGVLSGLFAIITIVVVSFYILLEKTRLYEGLSLVISPQRYQTVRPLMDRIENRLGSWVRGQLFLGLAIGLITWIGLSLLQVPYALPLAIIAGILELLPLIGPIIAAIPAILIALTLSPGLAIATTIFYIVVQQLESNIIVPKVMQRAVGLNPFFVLIAILAGGALMGILGALLAIPVAVVIVTILEELNNDNPALDKAATQSLDHKPTKSIKPKTKNQAPNTK